MSTEHPLPILITFDGEARSGKGTVVHLVKDALRDEGGHKVMLIDAGQVFRCLVVAATNRNVNLDQPSAIDAFLGDEKSAESCVGFVKAVYHMEKPDRDALLYTNQVSVNSAKVGARPLSQAFKDMLLKKWLRDARAEGYDVVLLDGRALEETGTMLEDNGLCRFTTGFYFVCDPQVGARRTLGYAEVPYEELWEDERSQVDTLVAEIIARNAADREREVQPIVEPKGAVRVILPGRLQFKPANTGRSFVIVDTSADMTKDEMSRPVIDYLLGFLAK